MAKTELQRARVCLCVLMNHPFVGNIPLLRDLYGTRFAQLRFLVPFERTADEDVITVYRGSYSHAAFLTDARRELAEVDCDYFLVTHDDVLLNPRISEETFRDYFPLGPDDGFHPRQGVQSTDIGEWVWNLAFYPQLLHPKSILFGGGVEPSDLAASLPSAGALRSKLEARGTPFRDSIRLSATDMHEIERQPSRVLLHGLTAGISQSDPEQAEVDRRSLEAERALVEVMLSAARVGGAVGAGPAPDGESVRLPLPVVTGGFYTDFYVLPKPKLDAYAHYVGVASAAHLFVEIMAPTMLYAVCERVWTADEFGLDVSGFPSDDITKLADPRVFAIHPYKLSAFKSAEMRRGFLQAMDRLRQGLPVGPPTAGLGRHAFGSDGPFADFGASGWHGREPWGRWASGAESVIRFDLTDEPVQALTLRFRAPTHPTIRRLTGRVQVNGLTAPERIDVLAPANSAEVVLDGSMLRPGELNEVRITSDTLVCPARLSQSGDQRELGFGLIELEFA